MQAQGGDAGLIRARQSVALAVAARALELSRPLLYPPQLPGDSSLCSACATRRSCLRIPTASLVRSWLLAVSVLEQGALGLSPVLVFVLRVVQRT